jgi:HEAT repeat protein
VAIKTSSSRQIESLVADLRAESAIARETALARLTVIGPRAVERLLAAAAAADAETRTAAWRALEAIGDPRALQPALARLRESEVDALEGAAAIAVAGAFLRGKQSAAAVDRLAAVALDGARHQALRLAALRALRTLDRATIAPILASLATDPNEAVRAEAGATTLPPVTEDNPVATIARAAEEALPDEPASLRRALGQAGDTVAVSLLLRIVERVREREAAETASRREQWTMTRTSAHVALARRGSRLGLYDLRETLDAADAPLPVEFLAALSIVGDATCLEAIAGAHAKAREPWWRQHLADTFHTIITREKLTRRHAVLRKIGKQLPQTLDELWRTAKPAVPRLTRPPTLPRRAGT